MRTNMGTLTVPRTRIDCPLQTTAKLRILMCPLNQWIGRAYQSSSPQGKQKQMSDDANNTSRPRVRYEQSPNGEVVRSLISRRIAGALSPGSPWV